MSRLEARYPEQDTFFLAPTLDDEFDDTNALADDEAVDDAEDGDVDDLDDEDEDDLDDEDDENLDDEDDELDDDLDDEDADADEA